MPDVEQQPSTASVPEGRGLLAAGTLREGSVLAGRYRLVRPLGRGGMGTVWEAEHATLGHAVAVKLIKPELAGSERTRSRFLREARAAASLRSPYVVQIFDCGIEGDTPYIAMERLEGESLAERLRRGGRLGPAQVVGVIGQVARAVGKAHDAGIVHRDLKPDNIYVVSDEDGERCKVLDFGIAKVRPELGGAQTDTLSGTLLGTPYYMSPEQATNASEVDHRSDLWSMAVIAYECLVGRRPFVGETLAVLSVKILADDLPVPSEHGEVPPGFDRWFARAACREPAGRFASARELTLELAAALEVEAPSLLLGPPTLEPRRGPGRWRGLGPVVGLGLVVGLGALGWWLGGPGRSRTSPAEASRRDPSAASPPASTPAAARNPPAASEPAVTDPGTATAEVTASGTAAVVDEPSRRPAPVELRLEGPAGTEIFRGDALLARLPDPVRLPWGERPVTLRVVAPGYEELSLEVVPSADQRRTLELTRRRRPPPPGRRPRSPGPVDKADVDDLEF